MSTKSPRPPAELGAAGRAFWRETVAEYDLTPDALLVLRAVCDELDLIERVRADMAEQSTTVRGSQNQPVANGLLAELRQHRALLATLLGRLNRMGVWSDDNQGDDEPDDPDFLPDPRAKVTPLSRSAAGRIGAAARWGGRGVS